MCGYPTIEDRGVGCGVYNGKVGIDRTKTDLYTRRTRESPGTANFAVLASRLQDTESVLPFFGRADDIRRTRCVVKVRMMMLLTG